MGNLREKSKSRPFFYLALFCLLWWGVPSSWKIAVKSGFSEFHAPLWDVSSRLDDLSNYWGHLSDSKKTLIEKGKQIQRIGHNQSLQLKNIESLSKEADRLRRLQLSIQNLEEELDLDQPVAYQPVITRITRRSLPSWWQSIYLRKGKSSSLEKGLGVIFKDGVVGRIHSVGARSSEIELITNTSFRIVAHFAGDERPVTFQGNGISFGGIPSGIVYDVPQDLSASKTKPLPLITSPLGGTFPKGILLGKVVELEGGEDGLFQMGQVEMSKELCSLQEVTVLVPQN